MNIIFVPDWLDAMVTKANQSIGAIKDEQFLSSTLSREDIAFYVHINAKLPAFSEPIAQTFNVFTTDETIAGPKIARSAINGHNVLGLSPEYLESIDFRTLQNRFEQEGRMQNGMIDGGVKSGLFGPTMDPVNPSNIRYIVKTVDMDTLGIVPKVGQGDTFNGMVNYLLLQLNMRYAFHEVASTPLFNHYMQSA